MPQMNESDFKKHMETGDLSGLYVLYGDEKYLVRRYAGKLIRKACGDNPFPDFNLPVSYTHLTLPTILLV